MAPKKFVISSSPSCSQSRVAAQRATWVEAFCPSLQGWQKPRITLCHTSVGPCRSFLLVFRIRFFTGSIWKNVWPLPNSLTLHIAFSIKLPLGHLTLFLSSTEKMPRIKFTHLEPSAEFQWLCEESVKQMKRQISYCLPRKMQGLSVHWLSSCRFFITSVHWWNYFNAVCSKRLNWMSVQSFSAQQHSAAASFHISGTLGRQKNNCRLRNDQGMYPGCNRCCIKRKDKSQSA